MARTIAEIQNEILNEKDNQSALKGLTSSSKTSIWRLWVNIVATAIWVHEKIVEKNALVSRPHTLNWYREQALNYIHGAELEWKDGSYQFDTTGFIDDKEIEKAKIIKYCAVSEVDLETVLKPNKDVDEIFSDYFRNKVGVVFIKVATENNGKISRIDVPDQLAGFKEYIARIKDAGNQVHIISSPGDILELNLTVYVDPMTIFIDPKDIEAYKYIVKNPEPKVIHNFNKDNGSLILDTSTKPVEEAIKNHLKNIEFNGAFVKTFLVDAIQKAQGVKIPVLNKIHTSLAKNPNNQNYPSLTEVTKMEYFIPQAGYFDLDQLKINVNYIPYTFYRDKQ
ncbi:hypothetical protein FVB9288_01808 [Flavobacterium sp. CECT 9288]|uniref:hypothetical protein n=1 Tax=Flavobacterium sp. CECT 9288 TaxID=2845819 RepID=UPI001E3B2A92|nr:hypothetical protein [Flavobacterium sp. CECT 9288]CAH0336134.1 hypothetical protein FVB9288_01808 [Flavobacterium sp. CECT 9288]